MNVLRILYFHQHFTTPDGAGGTRSYEMARKLVENGHHVSMVCGGAERGDRGLTGDFIKGRRQGVVDGIEVIELELPYSSRFGFLKRSSIFFRFAFRCVGVAMKENFDLIFATSTPLTVGIPGIVARFLRRKPFVFEVRDLWPELPREMGVITNPVVLKAMDILEWSSYRAATRCIGLSPGIVTGITRRGVDSCKVTMIPNGCDLELFTPKAEGTVRPEGVSPEDFMAIFAGAHGIANGLDAILSAAAELKRRGREDIKLVMVGDGMLKPSLMKKAKTLGLNNCIFLDSVSKKTVTSLQQAADVGLMILANVPAFYYGTSPNKFFDYLSTGLPVLNNYPGWLADLIEKNHCGVVVPPENPPAFANALEYLADHPAERAEMGKNSRRLAEREFSRGDLSARFVNWLEEAADDKKIL